MNVEWEDYESFSITPRGGIFSRYLDLSGLKGWLAERWPSLTVEERAKKIAHSYLIEGKYLGTRRRQHRAKNAIWKYEKIGIGGIRELLVLQ